jgi:hypothetical protein
MGCQTFLGIELQQPVTLRDSIQMELSIYQSELPLTTPQKLSLRHCPQLRTLQATQLLLAS